ncbi:MAG: helix-turn-helix domain-containing protein [Oscillospiraceae bacterium]|nr:helix-turn-helix domain-containing protein [Oscillospiraceae bacterium]
METKNIIYQLRIKNGLSQDELAEKVYVTRQAVSRWENGETTPNIETLKLLSKLFDVSINTLLGSPRELVCHCCGMPLEDSTISKEKDGLFNEEYCKWCYCDGDFTMDFWKQYAGLGSKELFEEFKQTLIHEFNTLLHVEGLPKVEDLNVLSGSFINLEYRLPNGETVKFLDDNATYLGNQLACETGDSRCFGIAANMDFLLVCTYEENGENPELVIYKKR